MELSFLRILHPILSDPVSRYARVNGKTVFEDSTSNIIGPNEEWIDIPYPGLKFLRILHPILSDQCIWVTDETLAEQFLRILHPILSDPQNQCKPDVTPLFVFEDSTSNIIGPCYSMGRLAHGR